MWIQRRERPWSVSTRDEMDARVMDRGEIPPSENLRWMGSKMGRVVNVCRRTK